MLGILVRLRGILSWKMNFIKIAILTDFSKLAMANTYDVDIFSTMDAFAHVYMYVPCLVPLFLICLRSVYNVKTYAMVADIQSVQYYECLLLITFCWIGSSAVNVKTMLAVEPKSKAQKFAELNVKTVFCMARLSFFFICNAEHSSWRELQ